jgi:[ribosomal protein S5]-alanine N-acetyltransferase
LRPTQVSDLPILFEFQKDEEAMHMAAFTSPAATDREAYITKWTRLLSDPTITSRTILFEGNIVGSVGSYPMHGEPQVTYGIDRSLWGRGIVSEALRLFLQEFQVRPLYGRAAFDNHRSMRVLEKCGFTVHANERGFAHARGAEIDEVVFVLR